MKKNARKILAISLMTVGMAVMMSSCFSGSGTVIGDKIEYTQADLSKKAFDKIDVETVADVYYTQTNGNEEIVRFDFSKIKDDKLRRQYEENVVAAYRDGAVVIGLKDKVVGSSSLTQNNRLCVYITSPDLVKATLSGVGSFVSEAINSDEFAVDNEGVGYVYIKKLLANKIDVDNEGVGNVTIDNLQGDKLNITNEGVGNVKIKLFKGGNMKIDNEGVGNVTAHVDCQNIDATLEGIGNIRLSGTTRHMTKDRDGIGKFSIKDLNIQK